MMQKMPGRRGTWRRHRHGLPRGAAAARFALALLITLCSAPAVIGQSWHAGLATASASTGVKCPARSPYATDPGQFRANRHPLVLVHGWNSNSDAMGAVESGLRKQMPGTFDYRYFDYRKHSLDWAASPAIAACLAEYVNEVSRNYRSAGGDGKVLLVAHSMGGLAIRFATDPAAVAQPIPASKIGGIVTLDTPHTGSVFGNTWQSQLAQWALAHRPGTDALPPDPSSDAGRCLALHDNRSRSMPAGCPTPPYLPSGTRLSEIAGTSTVQRTLFGVHLYDINLGSDGVVSVESSHGYLKSGPTGTKAPRTISRLRTATCTVTSDQTIALLQAAAKGKSLPGAIINAEVKALGILWRDGDILDALSAGRLTPDLEVMLATALFFYPCGHISMTHNQQALRDAAADLRDDLAALGPPTLDALKNAKVPSLCGHPAGTFRNGKMQNLPVGKGEERFAAGGYRKALDMYATGDLTGDGSPDAAAVLECNGGGVSWPDTIVFFAPGPKVLGEFDMGEVVGDARGGTTNISYANGAIVVRTLDSRSGDAGCCASGKAIVTLKWNGTRIVASDVQHLVGPTDITFTSIGPVHLGMTPAQLSALGYTGGPGSFGCSYYGAAGKPYVTVGPRSGVVAITAGTDKWQTAIGGVRIGDFSLLATALRAFQGYRINKYLNQDFGQGSDGIAIRRPGGVIGLSVGAPPGTSNDDSLRSVESIKVGIDVAHASNQEASCS